MKKINHFPDLLAKNSYPSNTVTNFMYFYVDIYNLTGLSNLTEHKGSE